MYLEPEMLAQMLAAQGIPQATIDNWTDGQRRANADRPIGWKGRRTCEACNTSDTQVLWDGDSVCPWCGIDSDTPEQVAVP